MLIRRISGILIYIDKMSRAPTAYFVFANEQRAEVLKELAAQSENGKPSVAKASKVIGERWKALSDEERQKYKDIAAQKSAELKGLISTKI